jgi:hypothetical protein
MTKVVVLAVLALTAAAAADTIRGDGAARPEGARHAQPSILELEDAGGYTLAGRPRTRVIVAGDVYLSSDRIAEAFPEPVEGVLFEIGDAAMAPDGTLALAIYNFGTPEPPQNAIQLWRDGELLAAYAVPPGTFGGGIAFTADGRVLARAPRGDRTRFFPVGG